jgi:hypothetical protein
MRKLMVLVLLLPVLGCQPTDKPTEQEIRRGYISYNRQKIREANRELFATKFAKIVPYGNQTDKTEQAFKLYLNIFCCSDPNNFTDSIIKFVEIGGFEGRAMSEKFKDIRKKLNNNPKYAKKIRQTLITEFTKETNWKTEEMQEIFCHLFEEVILQGMIMEGMSVEMVEASWNKRLLFRWSGSGYTTYEAHSILQKDHIVEEGNMSLASTVPGQSCRDFILTFKNGKLDHWSSYPVSRY